MAVYEYNDSGAVAWSTFDTWSTGVSSDANVKISTAMGNMHDAQSAAFSASELQGENIFYGSVSAGTGGNVAVTSPYSSGTSTGTIVVKNVFMDSYNVVLAATATYPYTFNSWRTAGSGGGSQISTSNPLTLTKTDSTSVTHFYAHFTTTHSSP